jgi:glycosyltransferase involved in cell wall biosynthesis
MQSISVIVPTFNRMGYLEETLRAILRQQIQELELIVVDDGSTDGTREFLEKFEKEFNFVKILLLRSNQGESCAVNAGWKEAKNRFITVVNSDDPPHVDWLRDMSLGINRNPGFGFYYPDRLVINEIGEVLRYESLENWSTKTLYESLIQVSSAGLVIDTNHLPENFIPRDPKVVFPSDLIQTLNLGLITSGRRIEGAWGIWREHSDSFSSSSNVVEKANLYEVNVRDWLETNCKEIQDFGNFSLREACLYGHMWRIYRKELGRLSSVNQMFKTTFKVRIFANPWLIPNIAFVAIRYIFLPLIKKIIVSKKFS